MSQKISFATSKKLDRTIKVYFWPSFLEIRTGQYRCESEYFSIVFPEIETEMLFFEQKKVYEKMFFTSKMPCKEMLMRIEFGGRAVVLFRRR